ncbi:MAG: transglutaminase domain-containing protein, partial [Desulfobacteraceae bacterium]
YSVFRLEALMWGQPMTFWVDESGTVLKEKGFMGLTLIKSSAASAPRGIKGGGGTDFYELAAINVKGRLQDPDKLTYLKLKAEGLAEGHFDAKILGRGRQRFRSGIIEVLQEKMPITSGYIMPYQDTSGKMKPFTEPEINIESDHKLITEKAREVIGNTRDPLVVARKLMSWVYRNVEKIPVITVPSALEVFKTRVGDCNEHAVLLTALLRASGIPARVSVGIVYARGKFFYHAWNEAFLGTWISIDAALNQTPTDATHIKLVEGGLDKQVDIIGLIGKLRLEIVDYGYD